MTVFNLGSINIDYIYMLPHLVAAGETLAAVSMRAALGGKGANQSIAIARAGGAVVHGGLVHRGDGVWLESMVESGVDVGCVAFGDEPTGHAIVAVDAATGENQIILSASSNGVISEGVVDNLLSTARGGDWGLAQNETNQTAYFLRAARERGLQICYSAAPFVADVTADLLPCVDLLIVNEGEYEALREYLGGDAFGVDHVIVTKGGAGADYRGVDGAFHCPAVRVEAVDTTGAGDTYLGYVLAGLDGGLGVEDAMLRAGRAAALQVTRPGASEAIPYAIELADFE